MNESVARRVVLVRAFERAPPSDAWSDDDRAWAAHAAAQVEGENATADAYIGRRGALAIERLAERDPRVPKLLASVTWPAWIGWVVPLLAFAAGAAADAIGTSQRINLLAPPLLATLAWNLAVYAAILVRGIWGVFDRRARDLGPVARMFGRLAQVTGSAPRRAGRIAADFVGDWSRASATLTAARIGRVLHVSAAAFALGAVAALYVRGIAFEYRAGWESTFLGVPAVQGLLGAVLGPASALTGIALPDADGYERLRFAMGGGVNAAPWLHLYAVTLALVVVLPRLLLALGDRWLEARLVARFPLKLDEPYYRGLLRILGRTSVVVRVAPYGAQIPPQATLNLNTLLTQAFGAKTSVSVAPTVAFGAEDDIDLQRTAGDATLLAPLFALTATPETENHGAFVDRLRQTAGSAKIVVLVDESAFRRQFGADSPRLGERRSLWRRFAADHGLTAVVIDLDQPDLPSARRSLQDLIETAAAG